MCTGFAAIQDLKNRSESPKKRRQSQKINIEMMHQHNKSRLKMKRIATAGTTLLDGSVEAVKNQNKMQKTMNRKLILKLQKRNQLRKK